jgi:peptide/nickel transport system ATP-binding protein
MAVLEIQDLSIDYASPGGVLHAVRGVSLAIEPGRTLGLVGESGSGKTSLGLAIPRLLPPNARITGGAISFGARDLLGLSADELRELRGSAIAMVFQDPMNSLIPVLSIGAQMRDIQFRERTRSRRDKRRHAIAMLKRVGIPDAERRIDDYPHQFSGGMRQRIAIAMALSARPDLLIADEPTTALDVSLEAQILDLLRDLRRDFSGATLIITHNLAVVAELCDEVAVMYAGEIVEQGPVAEIFAKPLHRYTRALLACEPGRLAAVAGAFPTIAGALPDARSSPSSCLFAPRCGDAFARCRAEAPPLIDTAPRRRAKCFLAADG